MFSLARLFQRRWRMVDEIVALSEKLRALSDAELEQRARKLRWEARSGRTPQRLAVECFALVREFADRELGKRHYPVQLYGGLILVGGAIAEMQTGEGKTLTAALPAILYALYGKGCHVVTSNEYLASRDADGLRGLYGRMGLTVGCVNSEMESDERREAYNCDITYGTATEMGFDFLRDRLRRDAAGQLEEWPQFLSAPNEVEQPVQRGHFFALVDEADSILIDDGRTPLIIALPDEADESVQEFFRWCREATLQLKERKHFKYDRKLRVVQLTDAGARRLLLQSRPLAACAVSSEKLQQRVETALQAEWLFEKDVDYMILDDEVQIIDESTGRLLIGRKWQDGLHQAVETKEGVKLSDENKIAARITVQTYYRHYEHLAGMTGTAWSARSEIKQSYNLPVRVVPTHRPCRRVGFPERIFATMDAKYQAISLDVAKLVAAQRAVLIGTPSVSASEALSAKLVALQVPHRVLNARQNAEEAEIVAMAGQAGRVTIATNMAGRGTDISLDETVKASGGLHVIATELHSSPRIDRQLIGRCARQGDPGTYQFFLSLDDELFRNVPVRTLESWKKWCRPDGNGELSARRWLGTFRRIQRYVERKGRKDRRDLQKQEQTRWKHQRGMGLDPCLDFAEDS